MGTHSAWVERMSEWIGPQASYPKGLNSDGLSASMERLQRRIEEGTAQLDETGPEMGPVSAMPPAIQKEFQMLMQQLKEDLSKELIRKLESVASQDRKQQDGLAQDVFAEVEEERKKINELEEALLFGKPIKKKKKKKQAKPSKPLTLQEQNVLLPILDEIEKTLLSVGPGEEAGPSRGVGGPLPTPKPPSLPPQHTFLQPAGAMHSSIPPPPPPPPPMGYGVHQHHHHHHHHHHQQREQSYQHYPADARNYARSIDQQKSAFNSNMEREDSCRSSSLASYGPRGMEVGGPAPSIPDTNTTATSRSSALRRQVVEPNVNRGLSNQCDYPIMDQRGLMDSKDMYSHGPMDPRDVYNHGPMDPRDMYSRGPMDSRDMYSHGPMDSRNFPDPKGYPVSASSRDPGTMNPSGHRYSKPQYGQPPPEPPRPSFRNATRSGSDNYSMVPPPPPPGPPPPLPQPPFESYYQSGLAYDSRGQNDDRYGSNWEVEETELTIY